MFFSSYKDPMSRTKRVKPYWEMTTAELREATKQFDVEFVADQARPLTRRMCRRWKQIKAKAAEKQGLKRRNRN
jgi:hypothetical protein